MCTICWGICGGVREKLGLLLSCFAELNLNSCKLVIAATAQCMPLCMVCAIIMIICADLMLCNYLSAELSGCMTSVVESCLLSSVFGSLLEGRLLQCVL